MSDAGRSRSAKAQTALVAELLESWALMEPFVRIGLADKEPPDDGLLMREAAIVRRWAQLFREEIDAVRRARDFVAHLPPDIIPISDLVQANEVASRLVELLSRRSPTFRERLRNAGRLGSPSRGQAATGAGGSSPPPPPPAATA